MFSLSHGSIIFHKSLLFIAAYIYLSTFSSSSFCFFACSSSTYFTSSTFLYFPLSTCPLPLFHTFLIFHFLSLPPFSFSSVSLFCFFFCFPQLLAFLQGLFTYYHHGYELAKDFNHFKTDLTISIQNVMSLSLSTTYSSCRLTDMILHQCLFFICF